MAQDGTQCCVSDRSNSPSEQTDCGDENIATDVPTNVAYLLRPAELMVVELKVGNNKYPALIDSGATHSLVRFDVLRNTGIDVYSGNDTAIAGLGGNVIRTIGVTNMPVHLCNFEFDLKASVVEDKNIMYPIILGEDFLRRNKFSVNLARRRVSFVYVDGSINRMYFNDNSEAVRITSENVPVYTTNKASVRPGKDIKIPVKVNFHYNTGTSGSDLLFYEGSDKVESINGIMKNSGSGEYYVLINNSTKKTAKVNSNECVGRMSTVVNVEDESADDSEGEWTINRLKEEISIGHKLSEHEKKRVYEMLRSSTKALSKNDADIGRARVDPHVIELTDNTPIWLKSRSFPDPVNKEIASQCKELVNLDISEYSSSQYSAPVVPIRKADSSLRLCIDYRKLNAVTKAERFPMPTLENSIYRGNNAKYFSKLDLVRGFYQVPIAEESRKYTAFSTVDQHYQFKRLSFGLRNSGVAFQKTMQQILSPFSSSNIIIYIDDILLMTESFEEHISLMSKVLTTLSLYGIKIKVKKCEFFKNELNFLGHVISSEGIKKSPDYVDKVLNVPKPTTVSQLRQYMGLINFQRKFIEKCSEIAKPLTEITGGPKRKVIKWTKEQDEAFLLLKEAVRKDVLLSYPDYNPETEKLELYVDASGSGAGACLMQRQNGEQKVIAYASMCFSATQAKYSATERELSAIRWGIQAFKYFLYGVNFILFTDHKPLIYLSNMSAYNSRLMRTLDELAEYTFEIRYIPGPRNDAADFLSRLNNGRVQHVVVDDYKQLPKGYRLIKTVDGGGDSMFEALLACLNYMFEDATDDRIDVPTCHIKLREMLVDELINNSKFYSLNLAKLQKRQLQTMKQPGNQPFSEILLAACNLFNIQIHVYCGMQSPVVFRNRVIDEDTVTVFMQCISLIHYNPVYCTNNVNKSGIDTKMINYSTPANESSNCNMFSDEEFEPIDCFRERVLSCMHASVPITSGVLTCGGEQFCYLMDTGAQVSLVGRTVYESLLNTLASIEISECSYELIGIGQGNSSVLGTVMLSVQIDCITKEFCFGVVEDSCIPCCFVLGANFIVDGKLELDFGAGIIQQLANRDGKTINIMTELKTYEQNIDHINSGFLGVVGVNNIDELNLELEYNSTTDDDVSNMKLSVSEYDVKYLQNFDDALKQLKNNVMTKLPVKYWKNENLCQFKRYCREFEVRNGILVKREGKFWPTVVSFNFIVEVLHKIHLNLCHVSHRKLLGLTKQYFWHPSMSKIAKDLCMSCKYCQLYKSKSQMIAPPIIKIKTNAPFELVAIDVLQFEKSRTGNTAVLVTVDHFSKWLCVVVIRDKKCSTIANALRYHVIPKLPRVPDSILSDNGAEFVGIEYKQLLKDFSINEVHSSPRSPMSNGLCERANRTLIQYVNCSVGDKRRWDEGISAVVVKYNNTVHSSTGVSPSQSILSRSHDVKDHLPVNIETLQNWKEGHPNFAPFTVGQKVIKRIHKVGTLLRDKLLPKYEGPFVIKKVQSNGISYEITGGKYGDGIAKVSHRHLRLWRDCPSYISGIVVENDCDEQHDSRAQRKFYHDNILLFGDGSVSDQSSDSGDETKCEKLHCSEEYKTIENIGNADSSSDSCSDNFDKRDEGSLDKYRCTERVNNDVHSCHVYGNSVNYSCDDRINCINDVDQLVLNNGKQSTPISHVGGKNFDEYMRQCELSECLYLNIEESMKKQDSLVDGIEKAFNEAFSKISLLPELNVKESSPNDDLSIKISDSRIQLVERTCKIENNFSGFEGNSEMVLGEPLSGTNDTCVQGQRMISELRSIISDSRNKLAENRRSSRDFRREIWEYRNSRESFSVTSDSVSVPIPNLSPKPQERFHYQLRSRGNVASLPNVQKCILERKK